jgi:molybdopterin molybdotransferase
VLTVCAEIPAGSTPARAVGPGEAARIMTGAPLPPGADAVVPLEEARPEGARVSLFREARAGEAIRRAGSLVQPGARVLARGETLRPADVGLLASLGLAALAVHRRPRVAVIATGDELTEIDAPPSAGRIVGDNSYTLAALAADCGAIPLRLPLVRDRREDLAATFRAAAQADLIVSAGGVSAGDYDLVRPLLQEPGNRLDFWQVAMTPGRALAFGAVGGVPVIALSGSPFAVLVGFEQFARPAIRKLQGRQCLYRRTVPACLGEEIRKKPGFRAFRGALLGRDGEGFRAVPAGKGGAGESPLRVNGLIVLPEAVTRVCAGEIVAVHPLDDGLDWTGTPA